MGGTIADQAVPVFNLVISFLFLGGAIFEIVKVYKEEKKKVLAIIEILALLAFAIYGYFVPYNNSVFHFSYRPLASAIHTTWLPAFIINVLNMWLIEEEIVATIGASIATIIMGFFIGQITTVGLWLFTGIENTQALFNKFTYYDNRNYKDNNLTALEALNKSLEEYKQSLENTDADNVSYSITHSRNFNEHYLQNNGYSLVKSSELLYSNIRYKIKSLKTNKVETYYFDSQENIFVSYTDDEIIAKEKAIATTLKASFEKYAILFVQKKWDRSDANDYLKENDPNLYDKFAAWIVDEENTSGQIADIKFKKYDDDSKYFTIKVKKSDLSIVSSTYEINEAGYRVNS